MISKAFKILYTASIANIINALWCEKNGLKILFTNNTDSVKHEYMHFSSLVVGGFLFSTLPALVATITSKLVSPTDNIGVINSAAAILLAYDPFLQSTAAKQDINDIYGNLMAKGINWIGQQVGDSTLGSRELFLNKMQNTCSTSESIAVLQNHIINHFAFSFKMNTLFQTIAFHGILSDKDESTSAIQHSDEVDEIIASI